MSTSSIARGTAEAAKPLLPGVQILRAVAALAVVVHHALEESLPLLAPGGVAPGSLMHGMVVLGACGVDLFFVISGFIMLHTNWQQFGAQQASGQFLIRRVLRIFPLYWLCVALVLVAKYVGGLYKNLDVTPVNLLGSLFLLPAPHHVVTVAWTLVFEMYFYYVFAAWLFSAQRKKAVLGVVASLLATWVAATLLLPDGAPRRYLTNPIVSEFGFGLAIAWLYRNGYRHRGLVPALALAVAALVGSAFLAPSEGTSGLDISVRFLAWGIPSAVVVWTSLRLTETRSMLSTWLCRFGDASYALYLTHGFVMIIYARLLKTDTLAHDVPPLLSMGGAIALSVMVGWAAHRCVERPITLRLSRLLRSR